MQLEFFMNIRKSITFIILLNIILFFLGCKTSTDNSKDDSKKEETSPTEQTNTEQEKDSENDNENSEPTTTDTEELQTENKIPQYFWGTWQRMDNGSLYVINDKYVSYGNQIFFVTASNAKSISVSSLGDFSKQSDSVMMNNSIPYFRKGGTNLEYKMKLVGFEDSIARAAPTISLDGYTVKGESEKYKTYTSEAKSDDNGMITLTAPVAGDIQTVTVLSGNTTITVVSGIKVENNGSNMGTIPLSKEGLYSLKVTGVISDADKDEKDEGYLYGNNYKSYPMTLSITNISKVTSAPSVCTITTENPALRVTSSDGSDISGGVIISTLKSNYTKTISLSVSCGSITDAFIDTGLIITIKNALTEQTWQDFVPLRFFKGLVPITVAAESTEKNSNAALNGFVIYPDGNSQFFSVPDGGDKTVYVPSFGKNQPYTLAFSGATIEGEMSKSTEMLYTVVSGTWTKKEVARSSADFISAVQYGESGIGNGSEDSATFAQDEFEAYLADGDVDFYSVLVDSSDPVFPNHEQTYTISYENESGTAPAAKTVNIGTVLSSSHFPALKRTGYNLDGWYIGNKKINEGFVVTSNIVLTARWTPKKYDIEYFLDNGTIDYLNPSQYEYSENAEDKIILNKPTKDGYVFEGWYTDSNFSGEALTEISRNQTSNIQLYAKWELVKFEGTAESLSALDLSKCKYDVSVVVTGKIDESTLKLLADKLKKAVSNISVDLSNATGITEIKGIVTPRTDHPDLNNYNSIFENCRYLKNLILPDSLEALGDYAFYNCIYIESIKLPEKLKTIGDFAFNNCQCLKSLSIPDNVTSIGSWAFYYCQCLNSLSIPDSVTSIGDSAFYRCSNLTNISIPKNIIAIDFYTFGYCKSLTSITIPASVTKIGASAFTGCESLKSIYFADTTNWYYGSYYNDRNGTKISVASSSSNAKYFTETYKDKYWYKKPNE